MSTLRKLRRARVTHHELRGPQKPRCKIADLPKDQRQLVRTIIRLNVEGCHIIQKVGGTIETAAQATEKLIDIGALEIVCTHPPESSADPKDIKCGIVPTGKY
jgi:hypothetical protein